MKTQTRKILKEIICYFFLLKQRISLFTFMLCICFFLTSCFSYRKIDLAEKEIKVNRKYKITTNDAEERKGRVYEVTDTAIGLTFNETKSEIPISDIKEIKQKKFSVLGNTALAVVAYLGVGLIAILVFIAS